VGIEPETEGTETGVVIERQHIVNVAIRLLFEYASGLEEFCCDDGREIDTASGSDLFSELNGQWRRDDSKVGVCRRHRRHGRRD
jgi:hypothetical protein